MQKTNVPFKINQIPKFHFLQAQYNQAYFVQHNQFLLAHCYEGKNNLLPIFCRKTAETLIKIFKNHIDITA